MQLLSCSGLGPPRPRELDGSADWPVQPSPDGSPTLFELFAAVAARAPDAIALEDGETKLSYADLLRQASHLAHAIAQTVEPGEPVGIALPNGVKYPVAMLAALATGRPFVALEVTSSSERDALILRQSGMKAIIVDHETSAALRAIEGAPPSLDYDAAIVQGGAAPAGVPPDAVARIAYTSGSEGRPKGVYITQRSLLHQTSSRLARRLSPADRHILLIAPAVPAAHSRMLAALLSGGRIVMVDLRRKGLQEAARVMARRGITLYASAPLVFRRLMELCRDPASVATIHNVNVSSDRVFASDVALFRERFPESCVFSSNIGSNEALTYGAWFVPRDRVLDRPFIPVGYALPGFEVRVVDEQGEAVPRGEVGEITVAGRYIAEGYWRDEALTRRVFAVDPNDPLRRINRTGDLGRMYDDGLLELVGRKDRQLKIRGQRVEPAEVEATLLGHPAIRDAAIIPRQVGDGAEIVAYATARPNAQPPTSAEMIAWLAERLPSTMRPRRVYLVPDLPMLDNFKPDIRKLEAFDRQRATDEADAAAARVEAPSSGLSVHDAVRSRWERVLGHGSFAADLSWDEAGGDSLKALELVFALEEMLERPVAMGLVGPTTRPSELIASLRDAAQQESTPSDGRMRLFFLPGWEGVLFYEIGLVQALARKMTIEVLDYPPVSPTRLEPVDFGDVVAHVLRSIEARRSGDEPIGLLGYSFGAYVAFAAAGRLTAQGVDVGFLGLMDVCVPGLGLPAQDVAIPAASDGHGPSWLIYLRRLGTAVTRPRYAFDRLVTVAVNRERYTALAWLWRALTFFRLRREQVRFREITMRLLRLRARGAERLDAYPGRISLFHALDNEGWAAAKLSEDLGWSDYCAGVEVWRVPGDHIGMLKAENIESIADIVVSQCERRVTTGPGTALRKVSP